MKRAAMTSLLSMKNQEESLLIVEDFTVESGKTKDLNQILSALTGVERTVLVLGDDDRMVKRAGRNISRMKFLSYNRLRAHDLLYTDKIVVTESAAKKLNEFYGGGKEE